MPANFIKLETMEQLDAIFERSWTMPVVLFKHSNSCGTSFDILEQAERVDGDVYLVVVQESRHMCAWIAELTGHRHHSPQAFVIKDGHSVYHATHYGINPERINKMLSVK